MNKSILKFTVLLVVVLLLIGGNKGFTTAQTASPTPSATLATQGVTFPNLTGPYKVGRTSYEWVDQSRDETFASIPGLKRDLMVDVWLPASVNKRTQLAPYMDTHLMWDASALALAQSHGGFGHVAHPGLGSLVHSHAYSTSNLDTTEPSYPVLIFVHGLGVDGFNYASILEDIASHGYVVIATSHPYSTDVIGYPDGRLVTAGAVGKANASNPALLTVWTQDVRFVLDQVEKLNATDNDFKGHLDLTRVGVFGHSFGGQVSIAATATDPRVKAGLTLDATGLTDASVLADLGGKPFLFIGKPYSEQQPQDKYWLRIDGMAHANYGDYGLLLPLIPDFGQPLGSIDPAHGIQIVDSYLVAFFDHYLKGSDLKWPTYPEVHLATVPSTAAAS